MAIAIEFLVEKPTPVGPNPMQKILDKLNAIKNKLSACTEVATGPQTPATAGKFWAQVAASVPAKYIPRVYTLEVIV